MDLFATNTRRIGFSLLELLAVVSILGVIAAVIVPRIAESSNGSKVTVTAHQIRAIANACTLYRVEHGEWPPTGGPHNVPAGLETYFPERYTWLYTCALGGSYKWWGPGYLAGWGGDAWSIEDMQKVDAILDDGDLAAGSFQNSGGRFRYYLY